MHERVDRAAAVGERRLGRRPVQLDRVKPGAVALGPRAPVLEADPVAQQQLRQPVTAAHQIDADRLPCAHEAAQRLLLRARDPNRVKLAGQQQPDEQLRVTAIGLDPVARRARNLRRRRDDTLDAATGELARKPICG